MASESSQRGGQIFAATCRGLKIFTLNTWRRLGILGRYTIICFHQQRLRRAWRVLGQRVLEALAGGEVNPMLAGEVKDSLARAQALQATKDRHYQAVAALREKIRITRTGEPPAPEEKASPAAEATGEEPSPGPQTGPEEGRG